MGVESGEMRELLKQWIEESQRLVGILLAFLEEYDLLQHQADTAERECERLRQEIGRLSLETESSRRERVEIAASLSHFMNDLLPRLHPRAGLGWGIPSALAESSRMGQGGVV